MLVERGLSGRTKILIRCVISIAGLNLPACGNEDTSTGGGTGGQGTVTGGSTSAATGGRAVGTGGSTGTLGGTSATSGGNPAATGGAEVAVGGTASGGQDTGGTVAGGTNTGGTSTGGKATGGAAIGGSPSGGNATGGNATGGGSCTPAATGGPTAMNAGKACLSCHASGQSPTITLGGTVYSTATGGSAVSGATVIIRQSNNTVLNLVTGNTGNFYTSAAISYPITISVSKCPDTVSMTSTATSGDCNSCHGSSMRIHLP